MHVSNQSDLHILEDLLIILLKHKLSDMESASLINIYIRFQSNCVAIYFNSSNIATHTLQYLGFLIEENGTSFTLDIYLQHQANILW